MSRLTMRTLIVAAMLAMPACGADVDAPADSPPQPAPAASQTGQDQTILADALAEVTAQYQTMLSEAGSRADELHAFYRHMIIVLLMVAGVGAGLWPWYQNRRFLRLTARHNATERRIEDLTTQLDAQREALVAQETAGDGRAKNFLQKAAAINSNMAVAYLSSPTCQLEYGLVFISNAVFTQNEASNSAELVMDPMDRWLKAAARPTMPPLTDDEVPMEALRGSWSQLVAVGGQRNGRLFWRKLETMEKRLREFLKGNDDRLGQIFGGAS